MSDPTPHWALAEDGDGWWHAAPVGDGGPAGPYPGPAPTPGGGGPAGPYADPALGGGPAGRYADGGGAAAGSYA
ncbi:hypothetical protein ACWGEU_07515, partial [Streptomyces goshikiensis]